VTDKERFSVHDQSHLIATEISSFLEIMRCWRYWEISETVTSLKSI